MYEQSVQGYDEALGLDGQDADTYHNRGLAYFSLGQYERSLEDFDEAIRLDPQLADAFTRRVMVFTLLSMDPEAQQAVDEAVKVGVERAVLEQYIKSLKMVR
jgi:tetratricopeptide (TPR) repeat protein